MRLEREWHIFSSLCITCALIFLVVTMSSGTSQIIGASMAPVVGGAFALSNNWKNQDTRVHISAMIISIISVLIFAIFIKVNEISNPKNNR